MNSKTKRITVIGMLCAITYVTMVVGRIPIILFLKYDPSDVIVTLDRRFISGSPWQQLFLQATRPYKAVFVFVGRIERPERISVGYSN